MVLIPSSLGGKVNIEIKGVAEALAFIRKKGKDIEKGSDLGTFQAANFVQQEIQESIIGNRPEPKSVATGTFANSISVDKIKKSQYKVFPKRQTYPGTTTTTQQVATMLEYGTSKIFPRNHFRNSLYRNKQKVINIIKNRTF